MLIEFSNFSGDKYINLNNSVRTIVSPVRLHHTKKRTVCNLHIDTTNTYDKQHRSNLLNNNPRSLLLLHCGLPLIFKLANTRQNGHHKRSGRLQHFSIKLANIKIHARVNCLGVNYLGMPRA